MLLTKDLDQSGTGTAGRPITNEDDFQPEQSMATTAGSTDSIPPHPMGVKPLGNQYLASRPTARRSLGFIGLLPDEMILHMLEYLETESLTKFGSTCRFLYAFSYLDDLWKSLFLDSNRTDSVSWKGTWRNTHLRIPRDLEARLDCSDVFSDVLHRPFECAHIALGKYSFGIPQTNDIARFANLTHDEFLQNWSNRPFILTHCIQPWPACRDWNIEELHRRYADVSFRAESVDWPFSTYYEYMLDSNDESPLYLFDRSFAEKMGIEVEPEQAPSYWPPECFGPDLFEMLGRERPAHRWLIVGPRRSGSTFHKDPNGTSAWNAVVQGSKYWIMFPPSTQVPGVYVSEDSSEVTSPLSIAEWLLEFHANARALPECIEGVCKAGEILHIPSGWWHLAVNLEAGIALTQNFVPVSHLANVLSFLKDKPEQITGFRRSIENPYDLFVERLRCSHPKALANALTEIDRGHQVRKRKWEEVIGSKEDGENDNRFSFGFGFADNDDDDDEKKP